MGTKRRVNSAVLAGAAVRGTLFLGLIAACDALPALDARTPRPVIGTSAAIVSLFTCTVHAATCLALAACSALAVEDFACKIIINGTDITRSGTEMASMVHRHVEDTHS